MRRTVLALLLLLPVATPAADKDEPLHISAKHVELDERRGTAVYSGEVVVTQGSLVIEAERVEATAPKRRAEVLRAFGAPARARARLEGHAEDTRLEARRIEYRTGTRLLELTGDAVVEEGRDRFAAPIVRYDLANQSLQASGEKEGRVTAVFHPRPNDQP
jgi:lipopolysaccharide export system protein LptA